MVPHLREVFQGCFLSHDTNPRYIRIEPKVESPVEDDQLHILRIFRCHVFRISFRWFLRQGGCSCMSNTGSWCSCSGLCRQSYWVFTSILLRATEFPLEVPDGDVMLHCTLQGLRACSRQVLVVLHANQIVSAYHLVFLLVASSPMDYSITSRCSWHLIARSLVFEALICEVFQSLLLRLQPIFREVEVVSDVELPIKLIHFFIKRFGVKFRDFLGIAYSLEYCICLL